MSLLGRELTSEERVELERWAHARRLEARLVERANIILAAADGHGMMAVCRTVGKDKHTVRTWVDRYLEEGIKGLHDRERSGHPYEYTPEQRAEVLKAALTIPRDLGVPIAHWTISRLTDYLHEVKKIPMSRARVAEVLVEEGLRWHHDEGWYGERVDPEFTKKRGQLNGLTNIGTPSPESRMRRPLRYVSTRWGR